MPPDTGEAKLRLGEGLGESLGESLGGSGRGYGKGSGRESGRGSGRGSGEELATEGARVRNRKGLGKNPQGKLVWGKALVCIAQNSSGTPLATIRHTFTNVLCALS